MFNLIACSIYLFQIFVWVNLNPVRLGNCFNLLRKTIKKYNSQEVPKVRPKLIDNYMGTQKKLQFFRPGHFQECQAFTLEKLGVINLLNK